MSPDQTAGAPQFWAARYDDRDDEELAAHVAARRLAQRAGLKQAAMRSPMAADAAEDAEARPAGARPADDVPRR